ncbi:MAG: ABC transporter permease subunit [Pseudotabrizicola sp.]|uniref:ABC transporter permease n=1 Tax=Pseudotabrizicola sp. TaxID=2939647 RepID=UPI0027258E4A|nr:ABC transporter permease subunit [Pseudotabrizicola sp.]MDO8884548.1 ABC transporter permease subunit [Pseudotabrizicola sp.]MDP2081271.1 ABC transporter permease subunit [Pseudotabrizicola sp.]MDZ7576110.1 ABC transporter permease subunit [Pseudotabrizicola sp.]
MTAVPTIAPRPLDARLIWVVAVVLSLALWLWGRTLLPMTFDYPKAWQIPAARWIGAAITWLVKDASLGSLAFSDITRAFAALVDKPYQLALGLLANGVQQQAGGVMVQYVPPISWIAIIGIMALLGLWAGGARLALLMAACFSFIAVFGQWHSAMVTLASILVAVPLGVAGGMFFGILAWRYPRFERALRPVLDLMQTMPVFAYLVPVLILFGFGPTAAVIATLIYATPPMTRITTLALSRVPDEAHDLARMTGCTPRQTLWRVLIPSAREPLMVGVNQVIMLSLNMVIIASMIGAGGLGFDVLGALRRLDFGAGLEAGLAIVALAIALDRLSQAVAHRGTAMARQGSLIQRHPYIASALALIAVTAIIGLLIPAVQTYPLSARLSTSPFWAAAVQWINITFFDTLEAVKTFFLVWLLVPVKRFLLDLPWLAVVALLGIAGWRLGGWRLALLTSGLSFLIAATGQWEKAMITVYLCGISTLIAMAIGLPIGILVATRDRLWTVTRVVIDTAQTLPSFVYLMPIVMLFRVGDFTAMIAVVAYAIAPAIRYTVLGLQSVDPRLIEAGRAMGCTRWQILTRIRLRLALPEILLGLNQTIMFALSMLVITALVGTRDLGQDVYIALTKANPGNGLVAGLAIAFIAIIADRLLSASARRARARLGLEGHS